MLAHLDGTVIVFRSSFIVFVPIGSPADTASCCSTKLNRKSFTFHTKFYNLKSIEKMRFYHKTNGSYVWIHCGNETSTDLSWEKYFKKFEQYMSEQSLPRSSVKYNRLYVLPFWTAPLEWSIDCTHGSAEHDRQAVYLAKRQINITCTNEQQPQWNTDEFHMLVNVRRTVCTMLVNNRFTILRQLLFEFG